MNLIPPPPHVVADIVERALAEDLGRAGDLTSASVVPASARGEAVIVARGGGIVAGLDIAASVFITVDPAIVVDATACDGDRIAPGARLATVTGPLRAILTAERSALNLVGHLSGIATAVAEAVEQIAGTGARLVDTRKTTPGMRALEKYAVRCGGGSNHRFGLDDAVMVKDNHIAAVGSITTAVGAARAAVGHLVAVEVEVDRLDQLEEAIVAGADVVLLDNMTSDQLLRAVAVAGGRCVLEASGGITLENARAVAETGVDVISMGWITHSAPNLDVALEVAVRSPSPA
jgi:nicotinate-nucleotide pyrophosphorylase (carboxylating)